MKALDVDGVRTVAIITVLWAVAFVVLALQRTQLDEAGRGWWIWTCLAGVGLGLLGLEYCRKRRDAIAKAELEEEADAGFDEVRDWRDGELAELAAESHDDVGFDEQVPERGYGDDERPHRLPPHAEPVPGHPAAETFPPGPYRGEEGRTAPPPPHAPYSGPGQQGQHRPEQPGQHRPEQPGQHRPEQPPTYSPGGRPPPGYVTGDFPAVPAVPTAGLPAAPPTAPPPAVGTPTGPPTPTPDAPHRVPDVASPAGYSPEPDLTRRHPRDQELARRFQEERVRHADSGSHVRADFLADDDDSDVPAQRAGYHEPLPAEREPAYREPEAAYGDSPLDYSEPTADYTGADTGYLPGEYTGGYADESEPIYREPDHSEPERPAPAGSELLSDLLGDDEPAAPSHAPEFLVDDDPATEQDDDYGGEYRGRRARRD